MHVKQYNIKSQNSLFVSDLDGTLFNSRGELNEYTIKVINDAINSGVHFTFATGKSYQTVEKQISKLNINIPYITYDGACVNDCNGELILCNHVEKNILENIIEHVYEKSSSFLVYSLVDGRERIFWIQEKVNTFTELYFANRSGDKRFYEIFNKDDFFMGEILFIVFIDCIHNIKQIEKQLISIGIRNIQINQDAYIKSLYWLKVKHPNANKGNAITLLKNSLFCDCIVSFGNDTNDIEMLQASDVSVCVENSNLDLKKIATIEIKSNDNDGVAKFLNELMVREEKERNIIGGVQYA